MSLFETSTIAKCVSGNRLATAPIAAISVYPTPTTRSKPRRAKEARFGM